VTEPTHGGPALAWLVVVDMQNVFADLDSPWATPGFGAIVDNIRTLVEGFAERVVFTRFVAATVPEGGWALYYQQWPFALVPQDDQIYALVDVLPHQGQPVVTRETFGKWDDHPGNLREATGAANTLVLTGVSTDCCVLSTALAAADAGVQVQVVADACAGLSVQDHQRALAAMSLYAPLVTLTSTADVLARL
jgi:nicotinamidase-related amidase